MCEDSVNDGVDAAIVDVVDVCETITAGGE